MTDQLTPQQEREYVEARWESASCRQHLLNGYAICALADAKPKIVSGPLHECTEEQAWHAAFLYTKEHERKIAEAEEEVDSAQSDVKRFLMGGGPSAAKQEIIHRRILAHAVARLAELLRGWKGEA